MSAEIVDEVPVDPTQARVYAEGWQSWSPATWYPAAATALRPDEAWQHTMRFRPGTAIAEDAVQAEGLLVVDPGDGTPARCYGATGPVDVPTITAGLEGDRLVVRSTGGRGREPGRRRRDRADGVRRRVRAAGGRDVGGPADRLVLVVPLLRAGHRRRRPGEPAGLRRPRPGGRRRPGRRRLEPGPGRGPRGRRRGSGRWRRWSTRCGPAAVGPGSGWRRSSSAATPPWRRGTPSGWSATPGATGATTWSASTSPTPACGTCSPTRSAGWSTSASTTSSSTSSTPGRSPAAASRTSTAVEAYRSGLSAGPRGGRPRRVPGRLRGAAAAERRAGRRDAGLPRHLPRGRRGRLARPARADAAGRTRLAAGPALGRTTRTAWWRGRRTPSGSGGPARVEAFGGLASFSDRVAELDDWGLKQVRELLARGGSAAPFDDATVRQGARVAAEELR